MLVERPRPNLFVVTASALELSALLAGARMALALLEGDPAGTDLAARSNLAAVLQDFDRALDRLPTA